MMQLYSQRKQARHVPLPVKRSGLPSSLSQSEAIQSFLKNQRIQPKTQVGQPHDRYEQEADRIADRVVSGGYVAGSDTIHSQKNRYAVQRMCEECEEELQLKPNASVAGNATPEISASMKPEPGTGNQLSVERRGFFESRMGHRFDDVRIHTDKRAARMARTINARAYTLGRDIVFNEGQYKPGTREGDKLLAHELTHVVQQKNLPGAPVQRSCFDGNCEDCAGGIRDMWVTVFFARRANRTTMQHLRTAIDGAKTILRNCCLNLKFDFNWTLIPNAATIETASRHPRPAGSALGLRDVPEPQETIGESDLIAGARGIPLLVVDEVQGTGGGTTILGGQDDRGNDYDVEYTGPSMFFIAVNQPNPNGNCNHIAHEIWHITGALRHNVAEGGITACTNNNVSETYCNALRSLV
ncbi:DUF4157 domain-containing protein [Nitrosomonas sp.]|uniref:eCIS core domain-containing protein n=1 Tax=Nitrosomonas sp. TaxID=42353 RepID=UPI002852BCD1|nr:DUF4157 domain-containing protein [Nitrosomonas sp.]